MKKILLSISAVTAMIAMTATFSACSSDDEQQPTTFHLSINASRGDYGGEDNSSTRAIALSNDKDKIITSWITTDENRYTSPRRYFFCRIMENKTYGRYLYY